MKIWLVEWVDSHCHQGWHCREHFQLQSCPIITSVGQILMEDENSILLCPNVNDNEFCDAMQIPKSAIRKISCLTS